MGKINLFEDAVCYFDGLEGLGEKEEFYDAVNNATNVNSPVPSLNNFTVEIGKGEKVKVIKDKSGKEFVLSPEQAKIVKEKLERERFEGLDGDSWFSYQHQLQKDD